MSAVLRRGRLVWRPLRHRISRYATQNPDLHRLLQHWPLPVQVAPEGRLHCPPQQTLRPVQVTQVPPPEPQSRFVLPAWQTPLEQPRRSENR